MTLNSILKNLIKNPHWLLLTLILSGWLIRLTDLDGQSLWYDEGVTWMLGQKSLPDLVQWTARDIQPPFYYLLIWLTSQLWGQTEYALRLPSALANTLTIPVMYLLALRLFRHRHAGLVAAFITVTSPVMVYYSQEARMYTLLVLEASLSSYLLLKILHTQRTLKLTLSYGLITALAFYTHYFAIFLWITHVIYILLHIISRNLPKTQHYSLFIIHYSFLLAPILLFTPWLPILMARLGDDPSYWSGTLKLDEALRKLLITFTLGETIYEEIGYTLALIYLAILFIVWGSRWHYKLQITNYKTPYSLLPTPYSLLITWLFLPPSLILALSYQSPKFNPRYTLVSWPAFALIIAGILSYRRIALIIGLSYISMTSAYSLTNWFTDPNFAKSDFRALAQFVKERQAADETVLLSSGHFYPVWAYYYGWQGWTALPADMPSLDVNRVINLNIAHPMSVALQDKTGAWLVNWQDEVIDPNGVVPFWLDWVGKRPHDAGDFWGVRLEHWQLTHPERLSESPIAYPLTLNFNNRLKLLGLTQLNDHELVLFWQAQQPLPPELTLTIKLNDEDGHDWARETSVGSLGSFSYPLARWSLGQTIITRHTLPWQWGTPPGRYRAEIEIGETVNNHYQGWDVLDEQGRPQRRTALLQPLTVSQVIKPEAGWQANHPVIDFSPIITLRKIILPQIKAEPGDRVLLTALWQAGKYNLDDVSLQFELIDKRKQLYPVGQFATPSRNYNLYRWQPHEVVLGQYWLDIPPTAAPGTAHIQIHLLNRVGFIYDKLFPLAEIEVLPTERNFTPPPQVDIPLQANFSGQATLLGLDCACQVAPGQSLTITLYWRGEARMETNYTIFAHMLDTQETMLIAADHAPPKPTRGWVKGEIIRDEIHLTIPADLAPGQYPFEVGLYDAADPAFTRLPLVEGETRVMLPALITVK